MWIKSQDGTRMADCVSLSIEGGRNSTYAIVGHEKGTSDTYILGRYRSFELARRILDKAYECIHYGYSYEMPADQLPRL